MNLKSNRNVLPPLVPADSGEAIASPEGTQFLPNNVGSFQLPLDSMAKQLLRLTFAGMSGVKIIALWSHSNRLLIGHD
jgi:hypothetical protein